MSNQHSLGFALVTQASHTQFAPGGVLHFPCVQSRMVLGCHDGTGTVELNGMEHPVSAGRLYLLPWGHAISYHADPADPFFVYGVHVIGWHRADAPVELTTPHTARHHLFDVPWRASAAPGAPEPPSQVIVSSERERPGLAALSRYAIEVFRAGQVRVESARALGELAVAELDAQVRTGAGATELPARLRAVLGWLDGRLDQPVTLVELARAGGCAPATITRMFRRYLGRPPLAWLTDRRIDRACDLLASSHSGIAHIGRSCGFDDPYYFSRVFKARTGLSPSDWRLRHQL